SGAVADQVCGCKKSNGKVKKLTSGVTFTCPPTQTAICWNEQPSPGDFGVGVHDDTTPSVPGDSSYFAVPFTKEAWDPANMHDAGAPTDLIAPVSGRYLVTAAVGFAETASPMDPAFNLRELLILNCGGPAASCSGTLVSGDGVFGQVIRNATVSTPVEE